MTKAVDRFAGLNGFVWWVGVITNSNDPMALGRAQVRIFGWHSENKLLVPDEDLPWASAMWATNSSKDFTPLEKNSWVLGFFMDGENGQFPIILGFLPGFIPVPIPTNATTIK